MPSLIVYDRRSIFAGDDLQPSSLLTMFVRVCQLCFFVIPLTIDVSIALKRYGTDIYRTSSCSGMFALLLTVFIAITYLYFLASIILEWKIYHASGIGTPIQPGIRHEKVRKLVEVKIFPMVIWITLISILGCVTTGFAAKASRCPRYSSFDFLSTSIYESSSFNDHGRNLHVYSFHGRLGIALWIAFVFLLATQLAETIFSIYALIRLLCQKKVGAEQEHLRKLRLATTPTNSINRNEHGIVVDQNLLQMYQESEYSHEVVVEMWDQRCRSVCRCFAFSTCYFFGGRYLNNSQEEHFKDISTVLADYFENIGLIDVVPSDILIGFLMLQKVQQQVVWDVRNRVLNEKQTSSATAVTNQVMSDRLTIHNNTTPLACEISNINTTNKSLSLSYDLQDHVQSNTGSILLSTHDTAFIMRRSDSITGSSTNYEARKRNVLRENFPFDQAIIAEGARFSRYALAIYTWVLYVYMHPISGPWKLLWNNVCKYNRKKRHVIHSADSQRQNILPRNTNDDNIVGDNMMKAHESSLLAIAGIGQDVDLIYANFNNDCNQIPYCVLADHKWESVVLSVRGTLSLEDLIVDGSLSTESLEELGNAFGFDGRGERCHAGILSCAKNLYRDLELNGTLESLLDGVHAVFPNYRLRVVGHSVGAGIATILSLMLRKNYSNLRCLAFSPPGQFLTWRLAKACRDFCSSYVLDSDFIPRLTVLSMEHLRNEILDMIGRLKVSKKEAMNYVVKKKCSSCGRKDAEETNALESDMQKLLHPRGDIPKDTEFYSQLQAFHQIVSERKQLRGEFTNLRLYPPGRIIHLVKTGQKNDLCPNLCKCISCGMSNAGSEYTPVLVENDDFNEIIVSETMWTDHFPNRVCLELEKMASFFDVDPSDSHSFEKYRTSTNETSNVV